jgi:hypothetical protein
MRLTSVFKNLHVGRGRQTSRLSPSAGENRVKILTPRSGRERAPTIRFGQVADVAGRAERGIAMDDWTIRKAHGESIIPDAAAETDASAMAERGQAKGSTPPFNRFPTKVGDDWETFGPVMSSGVVA